MRAVSLLSDECLQQQLRQCFAGLYALVPRVIKLGATSTPAVSEPRTSATTTTIFTRFFDGDAFVTFGPDGRRRRRGFWHLYVSSGQRNKREKRPAVTV